MTSLTLPDVKPYLGQMSNVSDAELAGFIAAAETAVEFRVGPLVVAERTAVVRGRGCAHLTVPVGPIDGVTSVTGKSGSTVAVERFSGRAGVIYFESALSENYYTVVYDAGWAATAGAIPADLKQAVAWQVQLDWQSMRGKAQRGPDDLRARIAEKLSPYMGHGFA